MDEQMTKARLIETLRSKRVEWDSLVAEVPEDLLDEPGVAGDWSVKDIIAHLSHYERWLADRLEEHLRGETYAGSETDYMPFEELNERIFQQNRHRSAADVLAESRLGFQRLVEGLEAQTEAFLIEPQGFETSPDPVVIWKLLRANVYDHYALHAPSIRNWLAARQA